MHRSRAAMCALGTATLLGLAGCSSGHGGGRTSADGNSSPPTAKTSASRSSSPVPQADTIPILYQGSTVKLPYVTETAGTQGAEVIENTTWKLTTVNYISYSQASVGGRMETQHLSWAQTPSSPATDI